MYPKPFEYYAPTSIAEACRILRRHKEQAKILAGGHSLVPLLKLRLASPEYLVDIGRIKGMTFIKKEAKLIRIGALTRYSEIEYSKVLGDICPMIVETVKLIADPQVRNRGTVGGNIAHGDPANDLPPAMIALKAEFILQKPSKRRIVRAENFFVDTFITALKHDEILTEVRIPIPPKRSGGAFLKLERKSGDFAVVSVAVQLILGKDDVCDSASIGLGAVGPTVLKARKAEEVLMGKEASDSLIREASEAASEEISPFADLRGSEEYKREMVKVFTERAIKVSLDRAKSGVRK